MSSPLARRSLPFRDVHERGPRPPSRFPAREQQSLAIRQSVRCTSRHLRWVASQMADQNVRVDERCQRRRPARSLRVRLSTSSHGVPCFPAGTFAVPASSRKSGVFAISLGRLARSWSGFGYQAEYPVESRHSDPGGEVIATMRAVPGNATFVTVVAGDDVVEGLGW